METNEVKKEVVSETKHTPGPWLFNEKTYAIENKYETVLAKIPDDTLAFGSAIIANARLIASAPELLEVCKDIIGMDREYHIPTELVEKLSKAISKAEGK